MTTSSYQSTTIAFLFLLFSMGYSCAQSPKTTSDRTKKNIVSFKKQVIHDTFISEGTAVGDVNHDGLLDILAGSYWFEAPNWTKHEIRTPKQFDYTKGYSDSFLNFTMDVNQDGWVDLIVIDFPGKGAYWYQNPAGKEKHWAAFLIDSNACNESPMLVDVDDNGRMDLVFGNEGKGTMVWLESPDKGDDLSWNKIIISLENSSGTGRYSHGLGFSDVNRDGQNDIIVREGWWEAPVDRKKVPWTFHEAALGLPCSQMYAYDFDQDEDNDVISASAHAYGIWWYESDGKFPKPEFKRHLIDSSFSQTHGMAFQDLNNDNLPDLITGKRFFAHQGKDPGGLEPPLLYWFELGLDQNNAPTWTPHLIDDDSGAGLQVVVEDINGDGILDILNANKKGVIVFWGSK